MVLTEPLSRDGATNLIHAIARDGYVAWTGHARREMAADGLSTLDCQNVMRCGAVTEPADLEKGSWRYRIHTQRMCVVVVFRSETELAVVTVWRKKQ
jgi:hypothetical protein